MRPSFYALRPGGWRDYVTLLHPPYTLWHLSYVAIGASLAPHFDGGLLALTALAFFLALGVGAHALDELHGRPLETLIPGWALAGLAAVTLAAAVGIGVAIAVGRDLWLLAFVGFGAFVVVAYNLELFGGRFHGDAWFAISWGGLPLLAAYVAAAGVVTWQALAAAWFAVLFSLAQRRLSTPVRLVRRALPEVDDSTREQLVRGAEGALRALTGAVVTLAVALAILRAR